MSGPKAVLVITDVGLIAYWALTAAGTVSVGDDVFLEAWNWSFLPLDGLAIATGLAWSLLPARHRWAAPMLAAGLALTHAAGLMAVSFFLLWGTWDPSWWLVNLWLTLMPVGIAAASVRCRAPRIQPQPEA